MPANPVPCRENKDPALVGITVIIRPSWLGGTISSRRPRLLVRGCLTLRKQDNKKKKIRSLHRRAIYALACIRTSIVSKTDSPANRRSSHSIDYQYAVFMVLLWLYTRT